MEFQDYRKVRSVEECVRALGEIEGGVVLLAGGTDVLVKAREGRPYADKTVVDVYGIPELCKISETQTELIIGAGVTHTQIADSPLVRWNAGVLSDACRTVGSLQIRNHATIGGNIANASPAADSLAALAVLEAEVEINCLGEIRRVPLGEIIEKPYRTTLTDRELITHIFVKKVPHGCKYDFYKLGRRNALSISRMTIATLLNADETGRVTLFHMTMGATFPKPMLFPDVDAMLLGIVPQEADVDAVAQALSGKIPLIAGIRPSTVYKQPVCQKLVKRILTQMLGGNEHE